MSDSDDEIPTLSYWPSVTDLFLTLFIIAIAIIAVVFFALLPTNNVGNDRAIVNAVGNDLRHVREPLNRLRVVLELEPVDSTARVSEVMRSLSETCDTAVVRLQSLDGGVNKEFKRIIKEKQELEDQLKKLGGNSGGLIQEIEDLRGKLNDKPPIIQITGQKKEYRFDSGSSRMGRAFVDGLQENEFSRLADEILKRQDPREVKVDTLEIIGHTDGVPISGGGNLDARLPEFLAGSGQDITSLVPGSNNDLGLLRALAIREQWLRFINTHEQADALRSIEVRCYSAGQTIPPSSQATASAAVLRSNDASARRIEMRLTRLKE